MPLKCGGVKTPPYRMDETFLTICGPHICGPYGMDGTFPVSL